MLAGAPAGASAEIVAPANDPFAAPTDLGSDATASADGTNKGASTEADEPNHYPLPGADCSQTGGGSSVWYRWTAPRSGTATVHLAASTFFQVAVYTGTSIKDLVRPNFGPTERNWLQGARLRVVGGTTYRIAVDRVCDRPEGDFTLSLNLVDAPANDDFADAIELTGTGASVDGVTAGATREKGEPLHGQFLEGSVWYTWTAPADGGAIIDLGEGDGLTQLAVYAGDSVDKLTALAPSPLALPKKRQFPTEAGKTYRIAIDGIEMSPKPFHFTLSTVGRPANDDFAAAETLTGSSASTTGDNIAATAEPGEPERSSGGGPDSSVWYSWTAPDDGRASIGLSYFGGTRAVYTGDTLDSLTEVVRDPHDTYSPTGFKAVKGTTYRISVQGANPAWRGTFGVTLDLTPSPPNDDFANPVELSGESDSATGTLAGATWETGESSPYGSEARASSWYRWTAPYDGRVYLDASGSSVPASLGVYSGTRVDALEELAAANGNVNLDFPAKVSFLAKAGETYAIALEGNDPTKLGAVKLNLSLHPTPPNDDFANAARLTGSVASASGITVGAGHETGEYCCFTGVSGDSSIWYRWRAPASGEVTVDTAGSDFDTGLAVATGSSLDNLYIRASNDDFGGTLQSQVRFQATAGTVYRLLVDGDRWATPPRGNVQLHLRQGPAPANDDFSNAQAVTGSSVDLSGTSAGATGEAGEPQHAGNPGGTSVWFRWTAVNDGPTTVSTEGSSFDTLLGVYSGDALGALTTVAANDDAPGKKTSSLTFDAHAGETYRIAVDGYADVDGPVGGSVSLSIDGAAAPPPDPPVDPPPPPVDPPPPPKTAPLRLRIDFKPQKLAKVLAKGLSGTASCSRPCSLTATMTVARGAARRFGLSKAGPVKVATAKGTGTGKGATRVVLRLPKATARKLAAARKVGMTVRVTARSGKAAASAQRSLTIRR
ncbi:MAG TPA: hypothetical protein VJT75_08580 [Thermoleophilaceae bacterium]|nr:hypothetical protein [Thermoleophilaceae bacterium]